MFCTHKNKNISNNRQRFVETIKTNIDGKYSIYVRFCGIKILTQRERNLQISYESGGKNYCANSENIFVLWGIYGGIGKELITELKLLAFLIEIYYDYYCCCFCSLNWFFSSLVLRSRRSRILSPLLLMLFLGLSRSS